MTQLVLTAEQVQAIAGVTKSINAVDPDGRPLGRFTPVAMPPNGSYKISPEELAEIKRRMASDDGTRYTTAEVLQHLRSLTAE